MTRRRNRQRKPDRSIQAQPALEHPLDPGIEEWITTRKVVILFTLLTVAYTFPLVFKMNGWILGKFKDFYGDIFWYIWCFWSAKVQLLELGKSPLQFDLICGPYSQSSVYAAFKTHVVMIPFTALFNQVTSLNIFVLSNFVLAGVFTWMMVRELTGSRIAGIVPGIAFAFCPYAYTRATVHVGMAPIWVFPFMFYVFCRLFRRFDKTGVLLLLLVVLCYYLFCSPYYYLIFPMGLGCWALFWFINRFVYDFKGKRLIKGAFGEVSGKKWLFVGIVTLVMTTGSIAFYVLYLRPMATVVVRPLLWQEKFALNWANYLVPSMDHPILGKWTSHLLQKDWNNRVENNVYLGWTLLLLALYGFTRAKARRDWRIWAFVLFGLAGYSITLGPYLYFGGAKLPMPSLLIHKLAPFLRSIGRYSICVMVTLAALAGFGIESLVKRHAWTKKSIVELMVLLTITIAFEYAHPFDLTRVPTKLKDGPEIYSRLAEKEKDATVFDYPPASATGMPIEYYFLFQTLHHRNLFNRYDNDTNIPDKYLPFWQDLDYPGALSDPVNLAGLKYFGVDYIVVHEQAGASWSHGHLPELKYQDGLELTEDLEKDKIYRLTAKPAKALIFFETRPFHNYLFLNLHLKNEGFEPALVPTSSGVYTRGWRLMLHKGSFEIVNLTDKSLKTKLRMNAFATAKTRRIAGKVNGESIGIINLDTGKPRNLTIDGIKLKPHGRAKVELESLDGTTVINSFYREVQGSAYFGNFELTTTEE